MHLIQGSNNLGAAIDLVARATVLRVKNGEPVTNQQELVRCAALGNPLRNSDPQIASAVNVAAGEGDEIALADPLGLHLGRPLTAGMVTPDGADAARFWKIERGDKEHTLRARFEVPAKPRLRRRRHQDGRAPDRVRRAGRRPRAGLGQGVVKQGDHKPVPKRCGA